MMRLHLSASLPSQLEYNAMAKLCEAVADNYCEEFYACLLVFHNTKLKTGWGERAKGEFRMQKS